MMKKNGFIQQSTLGVVISFTLFNPQLAQYVSVT